MNGFGAYLLKRGLLALITLFLILMVTYFLLRIAPGDPTRSSMIGSGGGGGGNGLSAEKTELAVNELMREKLHYDKPAAVGFYLWTKDIFLHGDFGTSVSVDKGRPVTGLILERLPVTLRLNVLAILITYLLAIPLGIFSGVYPDGKFDRVSTFILFFLYSLPVLWVALMLQSLFCSGGAYPVFPLKGLEAENIRGLTTWEIFGKTAMHYVLPLLCMTYAAFAGLSRFIRSSMIEVLSQDYIRTARAKGATESHIVFCHAFRNTLVLMATLFAGILPGLVSGSILIEYVFSIPGMGSLSMMALSSRDVPLVMALFAFSSFLTLAGMLLSDILYVFADPRIDFSSRM